jgi:hypothetical protein
MAQAYSDPRREHDPHALPDVEIWYHDVSETGSGDCFAAGTWSSNLDDGPAPSGWYYWSCMPGCLPDGEPVGPFDTEDAALADAQDGAE